MGGELFMFGEVEGGGRMRWDECFVQRYGLEISTITLVIRVRYRCLLSRFVECCFTCFSSVSSSLVSAV